MAIVYVHKREDTKQPFYIGIGRDSTRAYDFKQRSKVWKGYTKRYNFEVEILYTDLTWEEACKKEITLISEYGRKDLGTGCLLNQTGGGEGAFGIIRPKGSAHHVYGKVGKDHPAYGKSLKGEKHPQYGKYGANNKTSVAVQQIDLITRKLIKEYGGMREAARQTSVLQCQISSCCSGKVKSAGGYFWKKV